MAQIMALRRIGLVCAAALLLGGCNTITDLATNAMLDDPNIDHLTGEALGVNAANGVTYSDKGWNGGVFYWTAMKQDSTRYRCSFGGIRDPICTPVTAP